MAHAIDGNELIRLLRSRSPLPLLRLRFVTLRAMEDPQRRKTAKRRHGAQKTHQLIAARAGRRILCHIGTIAQVSRSRNVRAVAQYRMTDP